MKKRARLCSAFSGDRFTSMCLLPPITPTTAPSSIRPPTIGLATFSLSLRSLVSGSGKEGQRSTQYRPLCESSDSNCSKLKFLLSSSVTEGCSNSILLLGPRGSGKIVVSDLVIGDLLQEYFDSITVIRLSGLLHNDENCASGILSSFVLFLDSYVWSISYYFQKWS